MRARAESGLGGTAFALRGPRDASAPRGRFARLCPVEEEWRARHPQVLRVLSLARPGLPKPRPAAPPAAVLPFRPFCPLLPSSAPIAATPRPPRVGSSGRRRGAVPRRLPSSPSENLVLVPRGLRSHHHGSRSTETTPGTGRCPLSSSPWKPPRPAASGGHAPSR